MSRISKLFLICSLILTPTAAAFAQTCIDLGGANPPFHLQSFDGFGSSPAPQFSDTSNITVLNPSGPRRYMGTFVSAMSDSGGAVNVPGWAIVEEGSNTGSVTGRYATGNGSTAGGNAYSFGTDGERAMGSVNDDTVSLLIVGACFTNTTPGTLNSVQISFTGEMWRRGAAGAQIDTLDFEYAVNATNVYAGSFSPFDALDFTTPNTAGTAGPRDGNNAAFRTVVPSTTLPVTLAPGDSLYIRWIDNNIAGLDDGLAIDDFLIDFLIPSSAPVEVSGRVTNGKRGLGRVTVAIADMNRNARYAVTNPFGYYRFDGIASGQQYIVSVSSKSYQFADPVRVIDVGEEISGIDFISID